MNEKYTLTSITVNNVQFEIVTPEDVEEIRSEMQGEIGVLKTNKVDRDDNAPKLTAGFANNLVGRGESTEEVIGFRASAGGVSIEDGVAHIDKIKGNSVVWNQHYKIITNDKTENGVTFVNNNDGSVSVYTDEGGATADTYITNNPFKIGHECVIILTGCPAGGSRTGYNQYLTGKLQIYETGEGVLKKFAKDTYCSVIMVKVGTIITTPVTFRPRLYNLTQMFGAGNEPTTIEEFNARKPLNIDEYAYNEGELINMNADGLKMVGFNAWDEEWEVGNIRGDNGENVNSDLTTIRSKGYIQVIPSATYNVSTPNIRVFQYDENKKYITFGTWTQAKALNANCHYIRIRLDKSYGVTYNHDVCIHLVHTGYRNGEYETYKDFTRNIPIGEIKDNDGNQLFPYGLLSAGSAHDEITAKKAAKRIGMITFTGEENWVLHSINNNGLANFLLSLKHRNRINSLCDRFSYDDSVIAVATREGFILEANSSIYIRMKTSTADTVAKFKDYLKNNHTTVCYELTEPIEVDLEEPLNLDYNVWDFGTEEALSDKATTPMIADVVYQFNAVDRIRENSIHTRQAEQLLNSKADKSEVEALRLELQALKDKILGE